jgi:hypothetical protein
MIKEADRLAYLFLKTLSSQETDQVSMHPSNLELLKQLIYIHAVRVIKSNRGEVTLVFIERKAAIEQLKKRYNFHTVSEATNVVQEVYKEENS